MSSNNIESFKNYLNDIYKDNNNLNYTNNNFNKPNNNFNKPNNNNINHNNISKKINNNINKINQNTNNIINNINRINKINNFVNIHKNSNHIFNNIFNNKNFVNKELFDINDHEDYLLFSQAYSDHQSESRDDSYLDINKVYDNNNDHYSNNNLDSMNNNLYSSNNNFNSENNNNIMNKEYEFDPNNSNNLNTEENNFGFRNNYAIPPQTEAINEFHINPNPNLAFNHNTISPQGEVNIVHNKFHINPNPNLAFNHTTISPQRVPIIVHNNGNQLSTDLENKHFDTYDIDNISNTTIQSQDFYSQNIPSNENNFPSLTTNPSTIPSQENNSRSEKKRFENRYDQPYKGIKTRILNFWDKITLQEEVKREDFAIFDNIETNFIYFFTENTNKPLNKYVHNFSIKGIIVHIYDTLIPARIRELSHGVKKARKKFQNQAQKETDFLTKSLYLVNIRSFNFDAYFTEDSNNKYLNKKYSEYMEELQKLDNLRAYIEGLNEGKNPHTKLYIENAYLILTKLDIYLGDEKNRKIKSNFKDGVEDEIKNLLRTYYLA